MSVTYAPRHAPPSHHLTPVLLAGLDAAVFAVAVLALVVALLGHTHITAAASPLPPVSTSAPVHATPVPVTPQQPAQSRPGHVPGRYTVRAGDSLWRISVRAYGTGYGWDRIYAANRIAIGPDPGVIRAGQQLTVPNRRN